MCIGDLWHTNNIFLSISDVSTMFCDQGIENTTYMFLYLPFVGKTVLPTMVFYRNITQQLVRVYCSLF